MGDPVPDFTDSHVDPDLAWRPCEGLYPHQRACVVLRFREDCSFADIARTLEIPEATARSRVHRALAKLRTQLEAQR